MGNFFAYLLSSTFILVSAAFYGSFNWVGHARPLDMTDTIGFSAIVILALFIMGAAGATGWLRRKI